MKPKYSDWFPPEIKPVRKGVYDRRMPWSPSYSYWDGEYWNGWASSPYSARKNSEWQSSIQNVQWRGLARKPNAK